MNYLSTEKRTAVLRCLTEGCSMRATARITGVDKNTVSRVLVQAGHVCSNFEDCVMQDLSCKRLQADEIWSFVYAKRKNLPYAVSPPAEHAGDTWTWVAMCADTKLIPTWRVGTRTLRAAKEFMRDLKPRLKHRIQLTTDGHAAYLEAVEGAFGAGIDYAQLIKVYRGKVEDDDGELPASTSFIEKRIVTGDPDEDQISTSYIERQNLTMRMQMRRFTRRCNGFSKKVENHACAVALYTMHYNFCRIHSSLRVTPAMAAGLTERVWELEDLAEMIEDAIIQPGPRGPYRKKTLAERLRVKFPNPREQMNEHRERMGLQPLAEPMIPYAPGAIARRERREDTSDGHVS